MKKCLKCNEIKPISLFWKDKSRDDGLFLWCVGCASLQNKKYRKENNVNLIRRIKYQKDREHILTKSYNYRKNRDGGLFLRFLSIKQRCNSKNNKRYKDYGGRGIKCEWNNYTEFKKDMYESYLRQITKNDRYNITIERINNDGNYCKNNCIWINRRQQAFNKRNTLYLKHGDIKQRIRDLYNSSATVSYMAFKHRLLSLGWSVEKALTEPRIK